MAYDSRPNPPCSRWPFHPFMPDEYCQELIWRHIKEEKRPKVDAVNRRKEYALDILCPSDLSGLARVKKWYREEQREIRRECDEQFYHELEVECAAREARALSFAREFIREQQEIHDGDKRKESGRVFRHDGTRLTSNSGGSLLPTQSRTSNCTSMRSGLSTESYNVPSNLDPSGRGSSFTSPANPKPTPTIQKPQIWLPPTRREQDLASSRSRTWTQVGREVGHNNSHFSPAPMPLSATLISEAHNQGAESQASQLRSTSHGQALPREPIQVASSSASQPSGSSNTRPFFPSEPHSNRDHPKPSTARPSSSQSQSRLATFRPSSPSLSGQLPAPNIHSHANTGATEGPDIPAPKYRFNNSELHDHYTNELSRNGRGWVDSVLPCANGGSAAVTTAPQLSSGVADPSQSASLTHPNSFGKRIMEICRPMVENIIQEKVDSISWLSLSNTFEQATEAEMRKINRRLEEPLPLHTDGKRKESVKKHEEINNEVKYKQSMRTFRSTGLQSPSRPSVPSCPPLFSIPSSAGASKTPLNQVGRTRDTDERLCPPPQNNAHLEEMSRPPLQQSYKPKEVIHPRETPKETERLSLDKDSVEKGPSNQNTKSLTQAAGGGNIGENNQGTQFIIAEDMNGGDGGNGGQGSCFSHCAHGGECDQAQKRPDDGHARHSPGGGYNAVSPDESEGETCDITVVATAMTRVTVRASILPAIRNK